MMHMFLAHCKKGIAQETLAVKSTMKSTFSEEVPV